MNPIPVELDMSTVAGRERAKKRAAENIDRDRPGFFRFIRSVFSKPEPATAPRSNPIEYRRKLIELRKKEIRADINYEYWWQSPFLWPLARTEKEQRAAERGRGSSITFSIAHQFNRLYRWSVDAAEYMTTGKRKAGTGKVIRKDLSGKEARGEIPIGGEVVLVAKKGIDAGVRAVDVGLNAADEILKSKTKLTIATVVVIGGIGFVLYRYTD